MPREALQAVNLLKFSELRSLYKQPMEYLKDQGQILVNNVSRRFLFADLFIMDDEEHSTYVPLYTVFKML